MKLLVVDVGNTSTAVGVWDGGRVRRVVHIDGAERLHGFALPDLGFDVRAFAGVAYVSVVPKVDAAYKVSFRHLGLKVHQVTYRDFPSSPASPVSAAPSPPTPASPVSAAPSPPTPASSLTLSYPHPETIGADRLADAAGAVSRYGAPVLVMDFGTALTAAVVTEDAVWRGGVIAPGFPLMRDYLFERTAKLPRMELGKGRPPKIGRSTEEAMRFGALVGYRGMVREIVAELTKNFKTEFHLVATGGFARWALRDLDLPFTIDPTLTLYGAGLIASHKL